MSVDTVHAIEMSQRELSTLQSILLLHEKAQKAFVDAQQADDAIKLNWAYYHLLHSLNPMKKLLDERIAEVQQGITRMEQTVPMTMSSNTSTTVNGNTSTTMNGNTSTTVNGGLSNIVSGGGIRKKRYSLSRKPKARSSRKKRV